MNSQKERMLHSTLGAWRAALSLVIALALGGWLGGTAFAQQQQASATDTAKPVTAASANSKSASSSASTKKVSHPVTAGTGTSASSSAAATESYSSAGQMSDPTAMPTGVNVGNYNLGGSIDLGWRYSNITGSQANYDTFVNLQQGPRLFDFSFRAHSLNQHGAVFDNLTLTGFGFGGDPVDVVRLRMTKNKWYNFDATYRRYKYFWGYNLLANPLNEATTDQPIVMAPHLMNLSHRMTDLQLVLLPQSSIHFRLGYSHSLEQGPSYMTSGAAVAPIEEVGATPLLYQNYKTTDDLYHVGVDFNMLSRTTLSYDQYIQHYKQDLSATDAGLNYQLPNGVPADLGVVFGVAAGEPCNPTSTSTPIGTGCQANLTYDRGGNPRGTTPTEHFGFQTTYFRNLNMTGQVSYSSGYQLVNNLLDSWTGLNTRLNGTGSKAEATSKANQIVVNGDWNAVYQITSKLRMMDSFTYYSIRVPGVYNFGVVNFYAQAAPGGGASLELPPGQFTPTACPPPFTASTCPQHTSSDGPDLATGYRSRYLGEDFRSNTFQLGYDFTPKVGARVGYRYIKRKITDFDSLFYTSEVFYPGGSAGAADAFRSDCPTATTPGCTLQSDGSVVFSGLEPGSDTSHGLMADIDGNSALFGLWVRPTSNFRTSFNLELFSADEAFTRITPRQLRHYQINSVYTPVRWAEITGTLDIVDSGDNVSFVNNVEHNRSYGLATVFTPDSHLSFDLSYNYSDIYTQAFDCWTTATDLTGYSYGACPDGVNAFAASGEERLPNGGLATYKSITHFANAGMMVKPVKTLTFTLGYAGSFIRGTTEWMNPLTQLSVNFLDALTPWGPLRDNYQMPYVKMEWNVYKGLAYTAMWNYYGYNSRANNNPCALTGPAPGVTTCLAPLGTQDFNGNNMTMSAKYSF